MPGKPGGPGSPWKINQRLVSVATRSKNTKEDGSLKILGLRSGEPRSIGIGSPDSSVDPHTL